MKRFFAKISRFFWSLGFLKFVLWTVTIVVLLYAEEDWRGARAWAAAKAKWEAKGETFDYAKFIPPPVPDSENLGAVPLFQYSHDELPVFDKATEIFTDTPPSVLPPTGDWMKGVLPDVAKMRDYVAVYYPKFIRGGAMPAYPLAQFDGLFPFEGQLKEESAKRPFCRFDGGYSYAPPDARPLRVLAAQITVSKIITLHALLCLDQHRPDLALVDLKLNQKLALGAARDPTLIGSLVCIGLNSISGTAIYYGLVQHEWSDAQLAEIEEMSDQMNFLAMYQFAFRGEAAGCVEDINFYRHLKQSELHGLFSGTGSYARIPEAAVWWMLPWPGGWWDQNKCLMADFYLAFPEVVDLKTRRIFPERAKAQQQDVDEIKTRWDSAAPWRIWFSVAAGPFTAPAIKFSFVQARTAVTQIACALERFRLAHGNYPNTLGELVPDCIHALPHDIMNGEAYHYRLNADGTFLLYSVGWNQTDDGGKVVFKKDAPTQVDYEQGDWVWPTPKAAGK